MKNTKFHRDLNNTNWHYTLVFLRENLIVFDWQKFNCTNIANFHWHFHYNLKAILKTNMKRTVSQNLCSDWARIFQCRCCAKFSSLIWTSGFVHEHVSNHLSLSKSLIAAMLPFVTISLNAIAYVLVYLMHLSCDTGVHYIFTESPR